MTTQQALDEAIEALGTIAEGNRREPGYIARGTLKIAEEALARIREPASQPAPEPSVEDVERAIRAACPYFRWFDEGTFLEPSAGYLQDAPQNYPCRGCKPHDGPHGGTASCRLIVESMIRAAIAARGESK
jgi:hypothetical protein